MTELGGFILQVITVGFLAIVFATSFINYYNASEDEDKLVNSITAIGSILSLVYVMNI